MRRQPAEALQPAVASNRCQTKTALPPGSTATWGRSANCPAPERVTGVVQTAAAIAGKAKTTSIAAGKARGDIDPRPVAIAFLIRPDPFNMPILPDRYFLVKCH